MLINLKSSAANDGQECVKLVLNERLPEHVNAPCELACQFSVEYLDNYYLVHLNVDARLRITCQRCLKEFKHDYKNQTALAICYSDERAEKLMEQYECIVSAHNEVDLKELLTDELHLYSPAFHRDLKDCDTEISRFISL